MPHILLCCIVQNSYMLCTCTSQPHSLTSAHYCMSYFCCVYQFLLTKAITLIKLPSSCMYLMQAWAWYTWTLGSPCIAYLSPLGCTMGLQPIPKYTNISHSHKWGQHNRVTISASWVHHYYSRSLTRPIWYKM